MALVCEPHKSAALDTSAQLHSDAPPKSRVAHPAPPEERIHIPDTPRLWNESRQLGMSDTWKIDLNDAFHGSQVAPPAPLEGIIYTPETPCLWSESRHTCTWGMVHMWMRHVWRVNDKCHTCQRMMCYSYVNNMCLWVKMDIWDICVSLRVCMCVCVCVRVCVCVCVCMDS